jgi:predicted lactoylglutathione lyase
MQIATPIISLAVRRLSSTANWYQQVFGWCAEKHDEDTVAFKAERFILVLIDQQKFEQQTCQWPEDISYSRFVVAICFSSREEVNEQFDRLSEMKVKIIRPPFTDSNDNYKGYIADPEGNIFEVGWFPSLHGRNNQHSMFNIQRSFEH